MVDPPRACVLTQEPHVFNRSCMNGPVSTPKIDHQRMVNTAVSIAMTRTPTEESPCSVNPHNTAVWPRAESSGAHGLTISPSISERHPTKAVFLVAQDRIRLEKIDCAAPGRERRVRAGNALAPTRYEGAALDPVSCCECPSFRVVRRFTD